MADPNNTTRRALNAQLALGDRLYGVFSKANPIAADEQLSYAKWIAKFRSAVEWEEANNPDGSLPSIRKIEELTHQVEDAAGLWDETKAAFEKLQKKQQNFSDD